MMKLLHRRCGMSTLLTVFALISGAAHATEPFAVPSTDKLLEFDISLPDGHVAKVWAREGSMITVQGSLGGVALHHGFVPVRDKQSVRILPLNLGDDLKSAEQCGEPFSVDGAKGDVCGLENLAITFKGSTTVRFQRKALPDPLADLTPTELDQLYGKAGGGTCCVTCDGYTVCGSRVKLSCGSCDGGGGAFTM